MNGTQSPAQSPAQSSAQSPAQSSAQSGAQSGAPSAAPSSSATERPVRVFLSYAHEDWKFRDQLRKHVRQLERDGLIELWHDRRILPGGEFDPEIRDQLAAADVILFLVSADLLNSDYVQNTEIPLALARHEEGTARIVPIVIRPCVFEGTPLARFNAAPEEARPVASWTDRDDAWKDVAERIARVCRTIRGETVAPDETDQDPVPPDQPRPGRRWTTPALVGLGALPLLALGAVAARAGAAVGLPLFAGTLAALGVLGAGLALLFGRGLPFRRRWRRLPVLAPLTLLAWAALLLAPRVALVRVFNDTREAVALGTPGGLSIPPGAWGVSWAAAAALEPAAWDAWLADPGAAACASAVPEGHPGHCPDGVAEDDWLLALAGVPRLYVGCRRYERVPSAALRKPDDGPETAIQVRGAECEPLRPEVELHARWLLGAPDGVVAPAMPWCRAADGAAAGVPEDATVVARLPLPGLTGAGGRPAAPPGDLTQLCVRGLEGAAVTWEASDGSAPIERAGFYGKTSAIRAAAWQPPERALVLQAAGAGASGAIWGRVTCRAAAEPCRDVALLLDIPDPSSSLRLRRAEGADFVCAGSPRTAFGCWPADCDDAAPPSRGTVALVLSQEPGSKAADLTVSAAVGEFRFVLADGERLICTLLAGGDPSGGRYTGLSVRRVTEARIDRAKLRNPIETTHEGVTWRSTWTGPDDSDPWVCYPSGAEPVLPLVTADPGGGQGDPDPVGPQPAPPACYIYEHGGKPVDLEDPVGEIGCEPFGVAVDCVHRGKKRHQRRMRCH